MVPGGAAWVSSCQDPAPIPADMRAEGIAREPRKAQGVAGKATVVGGPRQGGTEADRHLGAVPARSVTGRGHGAAGAGGAVGHDLVAAAAAFHPQLPTGRDRGTRDDTQPVADHAARRSAEELGAGQRSVGGEQGGDLPSCQRQARPALPDLALPGASTAATSSTRSPSASPTPATGQRRIPTASSSPDEPSR